eukprot:TRINITY_DN3312_c0_g1_i1.p1 TRINITY_DN3312_c0_g1~~TRINITY_DN3312_c0_g1_i1.p1  ORF type:complete len:310 (+),score=75.68 TRINITY_DN3312_c0_g1_i1:586-1515(+)
MGKGQGESVVKCEKKVIKNEKTNDPFGDEIDGERLIAAQELRTRLEGAKSEEQGETVVKCEKKAIENEPNDPFGDVIDGERLISAKELRTRLEGVKMMSLKHMRDDMEEIERNSRTKKWCVIGIVTKVTWRRNSHSRITFGNLGDQHIKAIVPDVCGCKTGDAIVLLNPSGKRTTNPYTSEITFGLTIDTKDSLLVVGRMKSLVFCPMPVLVNGKKRLCNAPVNKKLTYQGLCPQHVRGGISRSAASLTGGQATGTEFFKLNPNKPILQLPKKRKLSETADTPPAQPETRANVMRKARYAPKVTKSKDS